MIKNNIFLSIVVIVLLAGNIYTFLQYVSVSKQLQQLSGRGPSDVAKSAQASQVLTELLDVAFLTRGPKTADDRIKLENDLLQLKDPTITKAWEAFVSSKDDKSYQTNALKVLGLLEDKMTQ